MRSFKGSPLSRWDWATELTCHLHAMIMHVLSSFFHFLSAYGLRLGSLKHFFHSPNQGWKALDFIRWLDSHVLSWWASCAVVIKSTRGDAHAGTPRDEQLTTPKYGFRRWIANSARLIVSGWPRRGPVGGSCRPSLIIYRSSARERGLFRLR